ncbi:hypothetical protein Tco_0459511 [Tanacetum coccineum]
MGGEWWEILEMVGERWGEVEKWMWEGLLAGKKRKKNSRGRVEKNREIGRESERREKLLGSEGVNNKKKTQKTKSVVGEERMENGERGGIDGVVWGKVRNETKMGMEKGWEWEMFGGKKEYGSGQDSKERGKTWE